MISISYESNRFVIRAPFDFLAQCKAVPGARWDGALKAWCAPASNLSAEAIGNLFRGHEIAGWKQAMTIGDDPELQIKTKTQPHHHQEVGVRRICNGVGTFLAWDMGTGKTKAVIDAVCTLGCKRVLILCPLPVVGVWPSEWAKHGACDVRVLALLKGTIAYRAGSLTNAMIDPSPVVVVMNYEASWREPMAKTLMGIEWDLIVCDEQHRIKEPSGVTSRFVGKLAEKARRRVGLTGTPIPHSYADLWAQYRFVDPRVLGSSYWAFRDRFLKMGGFKNKVVVGVKDEPALLKMIAPTFYRVDRDEVLTLPEQTHQNIYVDLSADAAAMYKAMKDESIAMVRGGVMTADNALAKIMRLQQVAAGFAVVEDDDGNKTITEVHDGKIMALEELLGDLPEHEPVAVFARFLHDINSIMDVAKSCGRKAVKLIGGCNEIGPRWRDDCPATVAAIQVQAGGLGIDLTRCRYQVFWSHTWAWADHEQALARTRRQGQKRSVAVYHLVARGTIDELILRALANHSDVVDEFMTSIKETVDASQR